MIAAWHAPRTWSNLRLDQVLRVFPMWTVLHQPCRDKARSRFTCRMDGTGASWRTGAGRVWDLNLGMPFSANLLIYTYTHTPK